MTAKKTPVKANEAQAFGWERNESTPNNRETFGYLNVTLEVAEGVFIQMPINCPLGHDIERMSKNQKKLMEVFEEKINTYKKSGNKDDLVINCNISANISVINSDEDSEVTFSI